MTKCPKCGAENPSGVGICKRCGSQIPMEKRAEPDVAPGSLEEELLELLRAGKKIDAIKLYRQRIGVDLKAAHDAVSALAREHNITQSGAGCSGAMLFIAAALAAAIAAGILFFWK
jgi:ribosomal protein L7/L12